MDQPAPVKQRHGCLTTWLVLMIIANSLVALLCAMAMKMDPADLPEMPEGADPIELPPLWILGVSAVLSVLNVVFAFSLFQWKKWAFFGYVGTSVVGAAISLASEDWKSVVGAAIALLLLYLVLQIGGPRKGWTQLE